MDVVRVYVRTYLLGQWETKLTTPSTYMSEDPFGFKHCRKRKSPNLTKSTVSLKLIATREIV